MKFIITLLMSAILLSAGQSVADETAKVPTITVSATGKADVAPDMAVLSLTVLREAETAREALDANNAAMENVLNEMKGSGIEARDLQTSNFSIRPNYSYPKRSSDDGQRVPKIEGYTVVNSLTVRIRNLDLVGEILDKSVTLGVNSGGNISFTTDDPTQALAQARSKAMANAIAKAKTLTESANVTLGKILNINEVTRGQPMPRRLARMAAAESADATVPIAAGENSYEVTVSVSWQIEQ